MHSLRRYGPALILASALLLLVVIAPSRGPVSRSAVVEGASAGITSGTPATGATGVAGSAAGAGAAGKTGSGATTSGASGSAAAAGGTAGALSGGGSASVATGGSTTHCVGGKQFALAGFAAAPPCQPTFVGNNGGATYAGVTATSIKVVYYEPEESLALQAILGPAGLAPSAAQISDYLSRATQFINARYELWGRKIQFITYQSQSCEASPPSDSCFRQDAQTIVSQYHPFAVIYPRNLTAPGFQQELSQLGVVNFGGSGLPESFDSSQAPYHYDYDMNGDSQAEITGEWYCAQLANRPAAYAGEADLRAKDRTAEILVDDTPGFVESAQHLASIINGCDPSGGAVIKTFSPDTSQAVAESTTLASQAKQSGITTLLYFTDPVLPVYLTPQLTAQDYYPENVVVGSGYLDFDVLAQLYDQNQWKDSFGLGDLPDAAPATDYDDGAVYRTTSGSQSPFISAAIMQGYIGVLAAGLQQAGPDLTPTNFERAIFTLPAWGDTRYDAAMNYTTRLFTGLSSVRVIGWSTTKTSPINGKAGTYVTLDAGRRFALGQFPSTTFVDPAG